MKKTIVKVAVALALFSMSGCAPALLISAAVTASTNKDNRTLGAQVDDQTISVRVTQVLGEKFGQNPLVRWNAQVHKGNVVLAGQVPSKIIGSELIEAVKKVTGVTHVDNELETTIPASYAQRAADLSSQTLINVKLFDRKDISSGSLSVMVENGIAHISGGVDQKQNNEAAEIAKTTSGIRLVVKHF